MSSQAVRNDINNSIRRVITDVKQKVIEEGKKKVHELKDQLLSPDQIIRILGSDINHDSCSPQGRDKFKEKADELKKQLDEIEGVAQEGLTVLNGLEEKIGGISSQVELSPGTNTPPNPIEGIKAITEAIKPITDILNYVVMASPAILASQVAVPGGGSSSGLVIANTNNKVNLAKAKISEYKNLFSSLPRLLDKYISMADVVYVKISKIKNQIQKIVDEIVKLKAFIIYLEMDFEDSCNKLTSPTVPSLPPIQEPPLVPPPLTLEDIIKQAEELYGNMLENLIAQGDNRAIKRVYVLGEQFQRIKNIVITRIDI
jgi:hypothetical protein